MIDNHYCARRISSCSRKSTKEAVDVYPKPCPIFNFILPIIFAGGFAVLACLIYGMVCVFTNQCSNTGIDVIIVFYLEVESIEKNLVIEP